MGVLQNINFAGTGTNSHCVLEDELMRRMTRLDGQGAFEGPKKKKTTSTLGGGPDISGNA